MAYVMLVKVNMMVKKEVYRFFNRLKIEMIDKMIMNQNETLLGNLKNKGVMFDE